MRNVPGILFILTIAMAATLLLLLILGNNPPAAGTFCLSDYYSLGTINNTILSQIPHQSDRWKSVRIYYSDSAVGKANHLDKLKEIKNPLLIDCHFIICNGFAGRDGEILPTYRWQKQWSITKAASPSTWQTIEICVVTDQRTARPTDFQLRTDELTEQLSREFNIPASSIFYPPVWR